MQPDKLKSLEILFQRRPELIPVKDSLEKLTDALISCWKNGGTLFVAGNGGSASDADHICGELLKGFKSLRPLKAAEKQRFRENFGTEGEAVADRLQSGLRAISLLSHPALASAFANDVDSELVYAQQLYALSRPGDVFIGISTSGGADNIRAALIAARSKGVFSALLTGNRHGKCENYADLSIRAPESETYLIQEMHISIYHALCLEVEQYFFGSDN